MPPDYSDLVSDRSQWVAEDESYNNPQELTDEMNFMPTASHHVHGDSCGDSCGQNKRVESQDSPSSWKGRFSGLKVCLDLHLSHGYTSRMVLRDFRVRPLNLVQPFRGTTRRQA
jgi:hypothetical protein